jgi:ribose transport system ATP-binding protein
MPDRLVEVQGLSRQYDRTRALHDVGFDLEPGRVYGLVGANGAGK